MTTDDSPRSDKVDQILQGALQEFLSRGYAGTSMDRVAATAGVSKPTVYHHFQDKEGLFCALVQHIAQVRFYGTLTPCPCAGPPVTTLRQLLEHMLESIAADDEYQDFVRLVIGESGRFPALARLFIIHITKPGIERVQSYLADHPELGLPDPVATAHILVGTVVYVTLTQHILHGQDLIALPQKRLVNALMALLLAKATPASEMSPDLEEVITGADDTL